MSVPDALLQRVYLGVRTGFPEYAGHHAALLAHWVRAGSDLTSAIEAISDHFKWDSREPPAGFVEEMLILTEQSVRELEASWARRVNHQPVRAVVSSEVSASDTRHLAPGTRR